MNKTYATKLMWAWVILYLSSVAGTMTPRLFRVGYDSWRRKLRVTAAEEYFDAESSGSSTKVNNFENVGNGNLNGEEAVQTGQQIWSREEVRVTIILGVVIVMCIFLIIQIFRETGTFIWLLTAFIINESSYAFHPQKAYWIILGNFFLNYFTCFAHLLLLLSPCEHDRLKLFIDLG